MARKYMVMFQCVLGSKIEEKNGACFSFENLSVEPWTSLSNRSRRQHAISKKQKKTNKKTSSLFINIKGKCNNPQANLSTLYHKLRDGPIK